MGKIAEQNELNTRVLLIDKSNPTEEIKAGNDSLVGIVFPTHGFTAPWYMLKFVWSLPRRNSTHVFCVATQAGLKFGPVYIPGISGSATFIIALILMLKGYNVRGLLSVDMPSNWFSLHPIQSKKSHEAIINRAASKVTRFMDRILPNGKVWFTINNLCELTWGILLSLISLGYLFFGRVFLAKLFFANKNCDGCGVCANYCSVGAINMWGNKNPRPFWRYKCESCMRCAGFCPMNAIEAGQSWGVILYFLICVPISVYFISLITMYIPGIGNLKGHLTGDILYIIFYYPAIFVSYYIFIALMRIPAINWIFTHSTMTNLFFWGRYREPNTKLKNIAVSKKNPSNLNDKMRVKH